MSSKRVRPGPREATATDVGASRWLVAVLVGAALLAAVALPVPAQFRMRMLPQDEGILLVYPSQILRGAVPNLSFSSIDPVGSRPGGTRPVLLVQANAFNRSALATVVVAAITSNLRLAEAPGNVLLTRGETGLRKPSVVNVSQLFTLDRALLRSRAGKVRTATLDAVSQGLRLALALGAA